MEYGFIYTGSDPEVAVELSKLAEAHGWHGFFVWEGIWATDPWATLAAAAVSTSTIRLGTMLTPVPRRRPWELAGQTMTVDRLSHGRVILSAGLGVPEAVETRFWIFESDPGRRERAERLDESLEMLEHLWRAEPFTFDGAHYRAARTDQMLPLPSVQQPRIPTWVVGVWPRPKSMRRAALADGWIPNFAPPGTEITPEAPGYSPAIAREAIDWIRREREAAGLGDRPYAITQEGTTSATDAVAAASVVTPWADAGVTWWLESDWSVPADEVEAKARVRIEAGPPAA
ncbi:LLM class flavin-dependent oxidoreductase [Agromyces salentinus]|uniref:LLM class flavin-dependent oxidoreductase n=1 Tax=Agromyces salentinus TaxID=269421 RepID=A0ABN2MQ08_9MICO|nr:LLM class flavin-dependent oxidoreductase [Agromyces salentinus]